MHKKKYGIIAIVIMMTALAGCKAKNGYSKIENEAIVMASYLTDYCSEETRYGVYDFDNDGNPELCTAENNSHADSVTVLAIDGTKYAVCILGNFGSYGSMSFYPGGYIVSGYTGCGEDTTKISKIDGGTLKVIHTLWDNEGLMGDECEYKIDDVTVTEEEYNETYFKYANGEDESIGYDNFTSIGDFDSTYENILGILSHNN